MDPLAAGAAPPGGQASSRPLRIALLDVARPQASRLSALLDLPHQFVDAKDTPQIVDAAIALRFGHAEAKLFEPRLLHLPGAGADQVDLAALPAGCIVCNVFEHEIPLAEYILAAILDHAIGYSSMLATFDSERWPEMYARRRTHAEIHGKILGLVGYRTCRHGGNGACQGIRHARPRSLGQRQSAGRGLGIAGAGTSRPAASGRLSGDCVSAHAPNARFDRCP